LQQKSLEEDTDQDAHMTPVEHISSNEEEMQCSSSDDSSYDGAEYTQFELDDAHGNVNMAVL
jgi:hypothetical protein